jgi:hypothetical protein
LHEGVEEGSRTVMFVGFRVLGALKVQDIKNFTQTLVWY